MKKLTLFCSILLLALSFTVGVGAPKAEAATYVANWCTYVYSPFYILKFDSGAMASSQYIGYYPCFSAGSFTYNVSLDKSLYKVGDTIRASGTFVQYANTWTSVATGFADPGYYSTNLMARNDLDYTYRIIFGGGCINYGRYANSCTGYGYKASPTPGTSGTTAFSAGLGTADSKISFFGISNYVGGTGSAFYGSDGYSLGVYGPIFLASNYKIFYPDSIGRADASYYYFTGIDNSVYAGAMPDWQNRLPLPLDSAHYLSDSASAPYKTYYNKGLTSMDFITPAMGLPGYYGFGYYPIASIPYKVCAANYGDTCSLTTANACGAAATNTGTIACDGTCSAVTPSAPALNPNYGKPCSSAANICSQSTSGTFGYDGTTCLDLNGKAVTAPPITTPTGAPYGATCALASLPNACGQTTIVPGGGTIGCSGTCTGTPSASPSVTIPGGHTYGAPCTLTSPPNACGMTVTNTNGTYGCTGTCTGTIPAAPANTACPPPNAPTLSGLWKSGVNLGPSVPAYDQYGYQIYAMATSPSPASNTIPLIYYFEWSRDGVHWPQTDTTLPPDPSLPAAGWSTAP